MSRWGDRPQHPPPPPSAPPQAQPPVAAEAAAGAGHLAIGAVHPPAPPGPAAGVSCLPAAPPAGGFTPAPGGVGRVFFPPAQSVTPAGAAQHVPLGTLPPPPPSGSGFAPAPGGVGRVFFPPSRPKPSGGGDPEPTSSAGDARGADDGRHGEPRGGRRRFREDDAAAPASAPRPRRRFREEEDEPAASADARPQRRFREHDDEPAPAREAAGDGGGRRRFREEAGDDAAPPPRPRRRFSEDGPSDPAPRPSAEGCGRAHAEAEGMRAPPPMRAACADVAPRRPPDADDLSKYGVLPNAPRELPVRAAPAAPHADEPSARPGLGSGADEQLRQRASGLNRYLPAEELARLSAVGTGAATASAAGASTAGIAPAGAAAGAQLAPGGAALHEDNLGHQMLRRMGWGEGEALAKGGLVEPIAAGIVQRKGEHLGIGLGTLRPRRGTRSRGQRGAHVCTRAAAPLACERRAPPPSSSAFCCCGRRAGGGSAGGKCVSSARVRRCRRLRAVQAAHESRLRLSRRPHPTASRWRSLTMPSESTIDWAYCNGGGARSTRPQSGAVRTVVAPVVVSLVNCGQSLLTSYVR